VDGLKNEFKMHLHGGEEEQVITRASSVKIGPVTQINQLINTCQLFSFRYLLEII
jgi:hypothetical protein